MKTDQQILDEAIEWVKAINKYFKIKQKIIVKLCYDKKSEDFFALTDRYEDAAEPYVIHLYPNHFRKGNRLFRVMYHEMVHILFHPLVGHLPNNTKLGKIEEAIVEKLERFAQRLSELKDETKKS
jgi:Zn-dependent peptidase ImmA (M78 family)